MPTASRTKCDQCGHTSDPFPDTYLTLRLDEPVALQSSNPHPDHECELILPTVGQRRVIDIHGFNYRSATREGRLVKYTRYYCRDCGNPYDHRTYLITGIRCIGCLWPIVGSVAIGGLIGLVTSKWWIGLLVFLLVLLIGSYILGAFMEIGVTRKLADRIEETKDKPRCPECASIETSRTRLKCPKCELRSAKLVKAGKYKSK